MPSATIVKRRCVGCGLNTAVYDAFEDCYVCQNAECGAVLYPSDFGDPDNVAAGIWNLVES